MRRLLVIISVLLLAACQHSGNKPDQTVAEVNKTSPPQSRTVATGEMCGGIAGFVCASSSDYCAMPEGSCQLADGAGVCKSKPEMCTMDYRPVCGCDGKTYGNACAAAGAGVNVDYDGECEADT